MGAPSSEYPLPGAFRSTFLNGTAHLGIPYSADGHHFLFMVAVEPSEQNGVYLGSIDGKESRRLVPDVSSAVLAAGRLLFIREDTMMAQPFDAVGGQLASEMFPLAEGFQ